MIAQDRGIQRFSALVLGGGGDGGCVSFSVAWFMGGASGCEVAAGVVVAAVSIRVSFVGGSSSP